MFWGFAVAERKEREYIGINREGNRGSEKVHDTNSTMIGGSEASRDDPTRFINPTLLGPTSTRPPETVEARSHELAVDIHSCQKKKKWLRLFCSGRCPGLSFSFCQKKI